MSVINVMEGRGGIKKIVVFSNVNTHLLSLCHSILRFFSMLSPSQEGMAFIIILTSLLVLSYVRSLLSAIHFPLKISRWNIILLWFRDPTSSLISSFLPLPVTLPSFHTLLLSNPHPLHPLLIPHLPLTPPIPLPLHILKRHLPEIPPPPPPKYLAPPPLLRNRVAQHISFPSSFLP